ncbi:hypothetical protein ALC56_06369 [Trachymyrmex septentrionalis]|uniref:Uncharacterized protein n=1 Tax=Trachymyrmex septentrionalis TaxID=34720 RepID=A0A151JWU3_9HYME|nr:hypothetical protein ALC56_06369 [Trachymyrmex septentrionalis]
MELLSRRSSGSRISTLKRSRSFRASMKVMSKIRNHANLRLTAGFDLSSVSKNFVKKECNLSVLEEFQDGEKLSSLRKDSEDMNSCIKNKIDNEASSSPRKILVSNLDTDSQEITKDLKSKLSLTDKLMNTDRKNVEKSWIKNEDVKLPKLIHIFRRRHSIGNSQEATREKDCSDKHKPCETDTDEFNKYVFYENPTFVLNSSLDSSISNFFYEVEEGNEMEQRQKQDDKNERAISSKRNVLTIVLDSHKTATNRPFCKTNNEQDKNEEEYLEKSLQNTFRYTYETESLRSSWNVRSDDSHAINVINGNQRTTESLSEFDRLRIKFYCKIHETERKNATICLQNQKIYDDAKIYPSKSCKVKTVDNITNFWTNRRGNSFRNKMATDRKRDMKDMKNYEQIDQERVFVSTSSRSKFHSLQGMEFLEGFSKKKQQPHQLNNLSSIHINPLSAQSLNIHLHALFAAVEHGHLDKVRTILESTDVNINR